MVLWNEGDRPRRGGRARPSRGRASSRPTRVASSRFARHHFVTQSSIPRKWKYRRARSVRTSDSRPASMARSRYCGIPKATEASRMPRTPRACAHRAPRDCHQMVSALCARMSAGNPVNDDTMTRWSSRSSTRISAGFRMALGSAASFFSSRRRVVCRTTHSPTSAARRCRDGCASAGGKRRVITLMPKQPASKPLSLTDRPAASRNSIAFVKSLEGEFDRRQVLTLDHTIIESRLDRQQAEPSVTAGLYRQAGGFHQVEIVEVPQFRLDDAPCSEERVLRSSTCRHSVHAHHRQSITPSGHPAQTESGRVGRPVPGARAAWSAGRR